MVFYLHIDSMVLHLKHVPMKSSNSNHGDDCDVMTDDDGNVKKKKRE